ncbi:hypothetical protein PGTUg99_010166 [Puccinia graminis f. sp. tritici]|uniref:Uncharacterized protein n=1 Tax=Puccinia graminis f. sp. tritici TaxID=56615 RepID=A0A5B0S9Z5_PUCGR|nr:hypothetical protein PGTUg99_010166 [Puccinia graminis f. sp. tritici]
MLVIEQVVSTSHNTAPLESDPSVQKQVILIEDGDSDIEIVSTQTNSKRSREQDNLDSPAADCTKRARVDLPRSETSTTFRPPQSHILTGTHSNNLENMEAMSVDNNILNLRAQSSGLNALKWIIGVLKTAKNRKEFARFSSVETMLRFRGEAHHIRRMVEERCAGVKLSVVPDSSGIANINGLNRELFEAFMESWQTTGWEASKRALSLLGQKKHRLKFGEKCTEQEMEDWKQRCWGIKAIVEENSPSVQALVQRR